MVKLPISHEPHDENLRRGRMAWHGAAKAQSSAGKQDSAYQGIKDERVIDIRVCILHHDGEQGVQSVLEELGRGEDCEGSSTRSQHHPSPDRGGTEPPAVPSQLFSIGGIRPFSRTQFPSLTHPDWEPGTSSHPPCQEAPSTDTANPQQLLHPPAPWGSEKPENTRGLGRGDASREGPGGAQAAAAPLLP